MLLALFLISGFGGHGLAASEKESGNELPPLSEARAAGRLKSLYLKQAAVTKPPPSAGVQTANLDDFKSQLLPAFKTTCVTCHGPEKQKGKFRIDTLNPDLLKGGDVNKWLEVLKLVSNGEMPPEDAKDIHLDDKQRNAITSWLGAEIQKASQVRVSEQGFSSFRRMTRYEYNYAIQDLIGLPYDFVDLLPPETASEDGFLNSAHLLQMSGMQFERYRELSLKALQKATMKGERPKTTAYIISAQDFLEEKEEKGKKEKKERKQKGDHKPNVTTFPDAQAIKAPAVSPIVITLGSNQSLKLNLGTTLPDEGIMRVRIRASGQTTTASNKNLSLRLIINAQTSNNAHFSEVISKRDIPVTAPSNKPEFIEFFVPLSEITRNPYRHGGGEGGVRNEEFLIIQAINGGGNLGIQADYIEICAPFYEQWPPKTHTDIFVDSKSKRDEKQYGSEVLTKFMTRAWRRPVTSEEVAPYLSLLSKYRPVFSTFEEAMVEVLSTVLVAPDFLYLTHKNSDKDAKSPQAISDIELASRLSFFLWCSIPDEELISLAKQGKLSDPSTLAAQTKRLLADPRSQRFAKNFVYQWLGLSGLDTVNIDENLYKGVYDSQLKEAMKGEPIAFFTEVLQQNKSIMDFIHSDYVMVNERLAKHYNISGVSGSDFRKVAINPQLNRGGLLTEAGILAMTSDGKDSHIVKRGVWVLKKILNDPPPPPPPNVPQVDLTNPKILQMTVKERIVDHREKPACYSCHSKIDPWGIAFENYDAVGSYRTQINNKPVDATSALFNKQQIAGMDGIKRYLLADRQDQIARAMVHKLTSFALGRPLSFSDRTDIDKITEQFRKRDDHLGDLVTLIVASNLFHAK